VYTRMLIPLDGSVTAEQVVPYARTFARGLKLPVNPFAGCIGSSGHYAVNVDELLADVRNEARNYLEEQAAELKKQGIEEISYILHEGDAAEEIVSISNDIPESLIVMRSHGRSDLKRA